MAHFKKIKKSAFYQTAKSEIHICSNKHETDLIHIDTISIELSIKCFKGSQVGIFKL